MTASTIPHLSKRAPWFVFLVHPRDDDDLDRMGGSSLLRRYSAPGDFRRKVCSIGPTVIGEVTFGFSEIRGELIGVTCMADEMMTPRGRAAVIESVKLGVRRGATVIGLGALTSPATGGGRLLLRHLPPGVTLTNGNAFTAAVVRRQVQDVARALPAATRPVVGIVGCTGSVGVATARLLAASGFRLVLIGRTIDRVRHLLGDVAEAAAAQRLDALRTSDVVVLLTHEASARLGRAHVKAGAVVLDCAQPPNVPWHARVDFEEHGVTVVRGGTVSIPGHRSTYDFGFTEPDSTFACLAETYLVARHGLRDHSVGRPLVRAALAFDALADRDGIRPSALTAGSSPQVASAVGRT